MQTNRGTAPNKKVTAGNEYDGVVLARPQSSNATELPWEIRVDESQKIRALSPLLFGYNHVWQVDEKLMFPNSENISPEFLAAAQNLPMPLNRMSGTDSQDFHWKEAIGPMSDRKPQSVQHRPPSGASRRLGPLEWVMACEKIDPRSRFSWTFNFWKEEPADHADLVDFLTGTPKNLGAGTNWADRRVALGRRDPIPVVIWELGNEMDWDSDYRERFPDVRAYIEYCRRTISAVRKIKPDARFAAQASTAAHAPKWTNADWRDWHRQVLAEIGQDLGWIVFHSYYHGIPISQMMGYVEQIKTDIRQSGHSGVGIYISEHARWPERPKEGSWNSNWFQTHSLSGCLSTAQFYCRIMQDSALTAATYHAFSGGPWSVIRDRDLTYTQTRPVHATGIAVLHQFLKPFHEGQILASRSTGDLTDPSKPDSTADQVAALGNDGKIRILLVNREAISSRKIRIDLDASWKCTGEALFGASRMDDVNTDESAPIQIRTVDFASDVFSKGILPAHTAAILEFKTK